MHLKVLLPYKVFAEEHDVTSIVAMTPNGAFGILPNRLDCVASLSAGILTLQQDDQTQTFIAIDEGVLVKTGLDVLISVRNAMAGIGLKELHEAVENEFIKLDEQEQKLRSVLVKMESGFIQRLAAFNQDQTLL
jgi:F-type H+-transporting ATPase subunit epsilon